MKGFEIGDKSYLRTIKFNHLVQPALSYEDHVERSLGYFQKE